MVTPFPISKTLANDYRNVLQVPNAPQNVDLDIPITPVAPINIGRGFALPSTKQHLKTYSFNQNANTDVQIDTPDSLHNVYFLGVFFDCDAATNSLIYDATSGSNAAPTDGASSDLVYFLAGASGTTYTRMLPVPRQINSGLRAHWGSGGANIRGIIYYITEDLI